MATADPKQDLRDLLGYVEALLRQKEAAALETDEYARGAKHGAIVMAQTIRNELLWRLADVDRW